MTKHIPAIKLATAPASEPLDLTEVKNFLKVDSTADDSLLTNLIIVVRDSAEKYMGCSLITQSWKLSYDKYIPSEIRLPMSPVQSITSVTAFSIDNDSTVISSSSYYLSAGNISLIFEANIISHRIEIIYVTGYGDDASDVPYSIKQGMLHHIAAIYEGRTGANNIPNQSMHFYAPYKNIRI